MTERLVLNSDDEGEYAACQNHVHHVFNSKLLANMLGSLPFQDVTLEFLTATGGVEVKANGTILALSSEYFYHELSKGIQRIVISHVVPGDLESIVKFLHTGTIEIGEDNYQRLYRTASTFTFPRVKQKCVEYLAKTITNENWIERHHFGYANKSEFLMGAVTSFIRNDIALHLRSPLLVSMQCEELNRILTFAMDPQYSPVDDGEILVVIVKWLEFEDRFATSEQEADELLNMVDMDLVKESHVQEIVSNTVLLRNVDFVKLLFDVITSEETKMRWFCHLTKEVQTNLALSGLAPASASTLSVRPASTKETLDTNHDLMDILSTSTSPSEIGSIDSSSSNKVTVAQPVSISAPAISVNEAIDPIPKFNTSSILNLVSESLTSISTVIVKPKPGNHVVRKSASKPPCPKSVPPIATENSANHKGQSSTTSASEGSNNTAEQPRKTNRCDKNAVRAAIATGQIPTVHPDADVSNQEKRKRSESLSDDDDFIIKKPKKQAKKKFSDDEDYSEEDESSEEDDSADEENSRDPSNTSECLDSDDDDFDPHNLSRKRTAKPFICSDDDDSENSGENGSETGSEMTKQSGPYAISESVHSRDTDVIDSHPVAKEYLIYLRYNEKRETSIMYTDLCMPKPRCLGKFKGLHKDASLLWVPKVRKLYLLGGVEHEARTDPDPQSEDPTVIDRWSVVEVVGISEKVLFKDGVRSQRFFPYARMKSPRTRFPPVFLGDYIYAIGGGSGQNCNSATNECEQFLVCGSGKNRTRRRKWETCADWMNQARCHHAVNVINDAIYVCGGYGTDDDIAENSQLDDTKKRMGIQNTVERFDPLKNKWSFVTKMSTHRAGCCSVALNGKLYVFGGGGAKLHTKHEEDLPNRRTAEVYDPEENCWTKFPDMIRPRLNGSAVVLNGVIYVIGGDCHKDSQPYAPTLSSVERYDPTTKKWHLVTEELDRDGNFISVAVINRR